MATGRPTPNVVVSARMHDHGDMHIEDVDERDSTWEQWESTFRVYFATGPSRAIRTVDVTDATFSEVHAWAKETAAPGVLIAIALVGRDDRGLKGLTWLLGMDPNDYPETPYRERMFAELHADMPPPTTP